MSVRKRTWKNAIGETKEAWVVDYVDQQGKRHNETFQRKKDADAHSITIATAAEDWYVELEGRERPTVAQYRAHVTHQILPRLGNERLASAPLPGQPSGQPNGLSLMRKVRTSRARSRPSNLPHSPGA
jgi:hypothetical protein